MPRKKARLPHPRPQTSYTKQPNEKLTPDEVRALTAQLVSDRVTPATVVSRWAFVLASVSIVTSLLALVVAVVRR